MRTNKKKTHEEYVSELSLKNPTVKVAEEYVGANVKITHHCLTHDIYWKIAPTAALLGNGCSECSRERKSKARQKSHEQYVEEVKNINPNIIVVESYINAKTPILHRCLVHDVLWNPFPDVVLRGGGCPECCKEKIGNRLRKTQEQYEYELNMANPNIIVLGIYMGANTPILHKCLIDGFEWCSTPNSILCGAGCPKCASNLRLTHQEYIDRLQNVNPSITPLEPYVNAKTKILHECLIDGYRWKVEPSSVLYGLCGCPKCNESKGEKAVRIYLDDHNIKYEREKIFNDCKDKQPLPFDFYLPSINTIIEYNGKQHYEPIAYFGGEESFKIQQLHDNIKREYCKNNNIRLLEIPYHANIEEELNNFLFI